MRKAKPVKYKFVNIVGVDGSGKTTLARNLVECLERGGVSAEYRYCQYFAKLLWPLKFLSKISVMRRTNEFGNYTHYRDQKKRISDKYKSFANLYAVVWLLDYILQVRWRLIPDRAREKNIIVDRYIYDIAVNIALATNNGIHYATGIIQLFYRFAPKPDITFLIDLPEEIAFSRKDDIQSMEYLQERRLLYQKLAKVFRFVVIDGLQSREELTAEVLQIIAP